MVSITRQRTGEMNDADWERMSNGIVEVQQSGIGDKLHIYEGYGLTIERLGNIARHAVKRGELDMLVLDYIQLVRTTEKVSNDVERLGHISKGLKQLALALNIPILTAAQVRRQSQDDSKKGGRAPTLDELRGSGDLEQDADNVLLIHSPDNPDDPTLKRIRKEKKIIIRASASLPRRLTTFGHTPRRKVTLVSTVNPSKPTMLQRAGWSGKAR